MNTDLTAACGALSFLAELTRNRGKVRARCIHTLTHLIHTGTGTLRGGFVLTAWVRDVNLREAE